jgi:hypothetical protein
LASHGFTNGASVPISGATQTEYNGTFTISNVTTNTFDFTVTGTPATPATGSPVVGRAAVYAPVSTGFESLTTYFNIDGVFHKMTGARGTVSFDITEGAIPVMKFEFTGVYNTIVDAAAPSVTLTAWQKPLPANRVNTPTFSIHSVAAVLEKLSINIANAVAFRSLIGGIEQVVLTDRKPAGSIQIEATTVAAKDWWTSIKNAVTGPLQIVHGLYSGNIVQIDAPTTQLHSPKYGDKDGIAMLDASLVFAPSSGNDEITITVK